VKRLLLWLGIPLLAWYISANWYQVMMIQGESMAPSYHHLQLVMLKKHDRDFRRGDTVAFWCEEFSCVLVKRIAAVPGDNAVIRDGTLYVNGHVSEIYEEPGIFSYAGILQSEIVVQPGEYLVLGDNVEASKDSRYSEVGLIHESSIYGWVGLKR
jgi:signal peptidase I